MGSGTIRGLIYGDRGSGGLVRRVRVSTARWLLAVTVPGLVLAGRALVDATGTRRLLVRLLGDGWTAGQLARVLGRSPCTVRAVLTRRRVTADTACRVQALACEVWRRGPAVPSSPGPAAVAVDRGAGLPGGGQWSGARLAGSWVDGEAPVAGGPDVDEVAVERAMRGELLRLSGAELTLAVRRLTGQGMSLRQIAARLHVSPRTVARRRSQNGYAE